MTNKKLIKIYNNEVIITRASLVAIGVSYCEEQGPCQGSEQAVSGCAAQLTALHCPGHVCLQPVLPQRVPQCPGLAGQQEAGQVAGEHRQGQGGGQAGGQDTHTLGHLQYQWQGIGQSSQLLQCILTILIHLSFISVVCL